VLEKATAHVAVVVRSSRVRKEDIVVIGSMIIKNVIGVPRKPLSEMRVLMHFA